MQPNPAMPLLDLGLGIKSAPDKAGLSKERLSKEGLPNEEQAGGNQQVIDSNNKNSTAEPANSASNSASNQEASEFDQVLNSQVDSLVKEDAVGSEFAELSLASQGMSLNREALTTEDLGAGVNRREGIGEMLPVMGLEADSTQASFVDGAEGLPQAVASSSSKEALLAAKPELDPHQANQLSAKQAALLRSLESQAASAATAVNGESDHGLDQLDELGLNDLDQKVASMRLGSRKEEGVVDLAKVLSSEAEGGALEKLSTSKAGQNTSSGNTGNSALPMQANMSQPSGVNTTAGLEQKPEVFTKLHTAISRPEWAEAFQGRVSWVMKQDAPGAMIMIDPPELGPIRVEINRSAEQVQLTFYVNHATTKDVLESQLARLRESLGADGQQVDVDVREESEQGASGEGRLGDGASGETGQARQGAIGPDGEMQDEVTSLSKIEPVTGLLDFYI